MKLVTKVHWNVVPLEGKHKIPYNNNKYTLLYNEYSL